jgi:hypothetical protein
VARRPSPVAHLANVPVVSNYPSAGFIASADDANAGKAFLGTRGMATGGAAGTIRRFRVVTATSPDDTLVVMLNSRDGDPGTCPITA